MDFDLRACERAQREAARMFGEREVAPSVVQRDRDGVWDGDLLLRMGRAGLPGGPAHGPGGPLRARWRR